ncbi:helix-turn-helix domain-containing protein [Paenibacillus sp. FSL W8-1187]|uniref:Transcriptional regulator, AraC family n=1 Tax=Paenibacillus pasadenensis TaxID=217090 RepID=A0A2N5N8F4_9BACL|nr:MULTISPECIES: helix-turn-helix domain-containing protein [Paenibacillus]PLT46608.1 Transcriptional regulator, AraC family [Paenibacillus pasadenensis]QGG56998.1 response regulator [Paenibacillus sp. B01]
MNALIVDDEIYAVKGLRAGVRWERAGIAEVYEAHGAEEARRLLLEREVDILICDIEMPEQSGLELVEWVRAEGLRLETVFLTCHSEFRYAQKALQLGSSDYILKPVIYAELEEVLRGLGARIAERRRGDEESERYQQMAEQWQMQKPLVAERRWNDLLEGRDSADGRWLELTAGAADADPDALSRVRPLLISVENWDKPISERDERVMEFALRKAAEELLLAEHPGAVAEDDRGNGWILLFEGRGALGEAELIGLCDRYRQACRDYFYCKMSVYIGSSVPVAELRGECLGVLLDEYRSVGGGDASVRTSPELRHAGEEREGSPPAAELLEWADLLEREGTSGMKARLAGLVAARQDELAPRTLEIYAYALLQAAYLALHRKGFPAHLLHRWREQGVHAASRSAERFLAWADALLEQIGSLAQSRRAESPVLRQVKAYIAEHLDRDLSREELAEQVYLNPAYLSRLFRKETGKVLTDYILQEKMRAAAARLLGTDESVSEIAAGLGYGNFSYFARLFRKVYGLNPQEYRKQGG